MTKDAEPHRALETEEAEQLLPLVIEVLPGQAGEGLVDIYQPGAYEGKSLRNLCESTLKKKDLTIPVSFQTKSSYPNRTVFLWLNKLSHTS